MAIIVFLGLALILSGIYIGIVYGLWWLVAVAFEVAKPTLLQAVVVGLILWFVTGILAR